jgi:hypothetical protein
VRVAVRDNGPGLKLEPAGPDLMATVASLMQNPTVEEGGDIVVVGGTTLQMDVVDCPSTGTETESVWSAGEVAKRDCQISC